MSEMSNFYMKLLKDGLSKKLSFWVSVKITSFLLWITFTAIYFLSTFNEYYRTLYNMSWGFWAVWSWLHLRHTMKEHFEDSQIMGDSLAKTEEIETSQPSHLERIEKRLSHLEKTSNPINLAILAFLFAIALLIVAPVISKIMKNLL